MELRITKSALIDFDGNGRIIALGPGLITMDNEAHAQQIIDNGYGFEVEDRAFETADHPIIKRKRR